VVSRLLSLLDGVRGACVISVGVLLEVARAAPAESGALRGYIDQKRPIVFPITEAVEALAQAYIDGGVLPERRLADAVHVAAATCWEADFLVSWNHRHMTRP